MMRISSRPVVSSILRSKTTPARAMARPKTLTHQNRACCLARTRLFQTVSIDVKLGRELANTTSTPDQVHAGSACMS